MIGKTIFHYKILEKLGEGGMGVVYKALDTKLDRLVALKFLPPQITVSPEDKARFLQEAKAASAVMHSNVCVIHDIAEHKDQQFIIMEYVDGKTLRQMVPIQKLQDAIDYAIQIGEALQEAHSKGVVHRDIKTDNIMVNTRNQIKVADFGLAKLKGSLKLTKTSSTVGTLAYMSPEQIQGTEVDGRSDIFSFGVVLYEMLTGHLPFHGEYEAAIMYSIVNEDPLPVHKYRPEISSEVLHILNRSLEKNPEERYQTVHDMVIDLKRVKKETAHAQHPASPHPSIEQQPAPVGGNKVGNIPKNQFEENSPSRSDKKRRKRITFMAATFCFFVLITAILFLKPFSEKPLPPLKTVPFTTMPGGEYWPAFSSDGNQIAFIWSGEQNMGPMRLYVKLIGGGNVLPLGTRPGDYFLPAWSPDGRSIAFLQSYKDDVGGIYNIPAMGGAERKLLSLSNDPGCMGFGLDWSPNGRFLVYQDRDSATGTCGIFMLSLLNPQKHRLTIPPAEVMNDGCPKISPDSKKIAFLRQMSSNSSDLYLAPVDGGKEKRLTFDNKTIFDLAWTPDGREIVFVSDRGGPRQLWRVRAAGGQPDPIMATGEDAMFVAISRSGHKLAFSKRKDSYSIWKYDMPASIGQKLTPVKLVASSQPNMTGEFSPDGKKIAFISESTGSYEIWICDRNGANPVQLTDFGGHVTGSPTWSPDGKFIAFDSRPQGHSDIFIISAEGGPSRNVTNEPSDDRMPKWSSDGRWIYYISNRGKAGENFQLWKVPVEGGKPALVSNETGWCFFISHDGKSLYYSKNGVQKLSLQDGKKQSYSDLSTTSNWVLVEDGIYYLVQYETMASLEFLEFASGRTTKIAELLNKSYLFDLSISPDRRSVIAGSQEMGDADIYLVENFR